MGQFSLLSVYVIVCLVICLVIYYALLTYCTYCLDLSKLNGIDNSCKIV